VLAQFDQHAVGTLRVEERDAGLAGEFATLASGTTPVLSTEPAAVRSRRGVLSGGSALAVHAVTTQNARSVRRMGVGYWHMEI